MRVVFAAGAAGLALSAGAASAQACRQETPEATRCRFVLSEPRVFTVEAGALLAGRTDGRGATLAITVDGRPCRASRDSRPDRVLASCRVTLAAATHVVEAAVAGAPARGVGLRLAPSERLAELPREARTLDPPRRRGPLAWLGLSLGRRVDRAR